MAESGRTVACTVVAGYQLPAAAVLARSYLAHHPAHRFVVGVVDGPPEGVTIEGVDLVGPESFDIDATDYLRMATSYTAAELAAAVKPHLMRRLLTDAAVALFLAPDIRVYAPFDEVAGLAAEHDIVLTPKFLEPLPRDDHEPAETAVMAGGMFDLGFLAVSQGAKGFLDFWADRLRHDSVIAPEVQLYADQRWADQIPALFRHTVLRDPGFNAAYWNLHERAVAEEPGGALTAGGEPLRFFHFAGYRPDQRWLLSSDVAVRPRVLLSESPALLRLCESYRDELLAEGHKDYLEPDDPAPYGFGALGDGTPLTLPMRRMFRHAWVEAERPDADQLLFRRAITEVPPHPFGADDGAGFRSWLSEPSTPPEHAAGLSRMAMLVWASRPDLQRAFPWPCAGDAESFREWCTTYGKTEKMLPDWAMPHEPAPLAEPVDTFGVNLAGYLTAELGLGEMGRIVLRAIQQAGVPVVSVVEEHSLSCRSALDAPDSVGRPRFPVSLLSVNSDQTELLLASSPEVGYRRYRIGLWAWELEEVPEWQRHGLDHVDEIWTVSEFTKDAFAEHAGVPVKVFPVPIADPGGPTRPRRQADRPLQFLFCFDYNSIGQRKNPWGLVTAFQRAFPDRDDVRLVIKATNSQLNVRAAEQLRSMAAADPRVELLERYLSVEDLAALYANSDCYVSLHRSEGFGLTVAEAMVRAMPVIATAYSGTTEFFDETVGWPISYDMVKVGPGWYPYQADALWADPDLDEAAAAMRAVADDPAEAARRGDAAREHILRTRSVAAAAKWLRTELTAAHHAWRDHNADLHSATTKPTTASVVRGGLARAREALRWRADVGTDSRNPIAPMVRRAVLRTIDHYDVHQRRIMAEVVDDTEQSLGELAEQVRKVESDANRRIRSLGEQLRAIEQHLGARPGKDTDDKPKGSAG